MKSVLQWAIIATLGVMLGKLLSPIYYLMDTSIFITLATNLIMILLMIFTIISTGRATRQHIETIERESREQTKKNEQWINIKRKQLIKSVIRELKYNISVYGKIKENTENNLYKPHLSNFLYTSVGKCITDSPVDKDEINQRILELYSMAKIHENKIVVTRIPNLTATSIKGLLDSIASEFTTNKHLIEETLEMLEEYDQGLTV